jgi:hypothetical protein
MELSLTRIVDRLAGGDLYAFERLQALYVAEITAGTGITTPSSGIPVSSFQSATSPQHMTHRSPLA